MSSFGSEGRCCSGSEVPETTHDRLAHSGRVVQCACATHPEFCQPFRQRVHTVGNIWAKQAPVNHCLEHVWKPVHEVHNC